MRSNAPGRVELGAPGTPFADEERCHKDTPAAATSGRAAAKQIAHATSLEYESAPHGLLATEKERPTKDLLAFFSAPKT